MTDWDKWIESFDCIDCIHFGSVFCFFDHYSNDSIFGHIVTINDHAYHSIHVWRFRKWIIHWINESSVVNTHWLNIKSMPNVEMHWRTATGVSVEFEIIFVCSLFTNTKASMVDAAHRYICTRNFLSANETVSFLFMLTTCTCSQRFRMNVTLEIVAHWNGISNRFRLLFGPQKL